MKKNTKKKILTLALVIALLAIVTIGGSLAWFTAEDKEVNTFTVGSIKIEQHEKQYGENGKLEDFEDNKVLLPIVNTETPSDDVNYQDKIVTVENTGNNPAYIRTFIAFPAALEDNYLKLDFSDDVGEGKSWQKQWYWPNFEYNGVSYVVHCYVYMSELAKDATTPVLLEGVYLQAPVDIQENDDGKMEFCLSDGKGGYTFSGYVAEDDNGNYKNIDVLVLTEAVQAQGFETEGAQGSLNTAFGSLNNGYNPFATSDEG